MLAAAVELRKECEAEGSRIRLGEDVVIFLRDCQPAIIRVTGILPRSSTLLVEPFNRALRGP